MAYPLLLYFVLWAICGRSSLELGYNKAEGTLFLYPYILLTINDLIIQDLKLLPICKI